MREELDAKKRMIIVKDMAGNWMSVLVGSAHVYAHGYGQELGCQRDDDAF